MSSHTRAFGRSLPRDMQAERAALLIAAGQQSLLSPTPLWKVNDERAGKNGNCQAVYWVKERHVATELKRRGGSGGLGGGQSAPERQWDTGSVYKGEWKHNLKHGYGTQIWANGNKYEGEWAGGNREGHGVLWLKEKPSAKAAGEEEKSSAAAAAASSSSKGGAAASSAKKLRRVYAGNWKNDQKDGVGVYFYPDGSRYEGSWSCDVRCGRGTLYSPDGSSYTGAWSSDLQNGFGTLSKSNGDVYEGEWLNGRREGSGIHYFKAQEKIYDGEWVNDQPKCGVYCDAKEFFNDDEEDARYNAAAGVRRLARDGQPVSAEEDARSLAAAAHQPPPGSVSPRVPRNRGGMPIPRLRMADADGVLAAAIEAVGAERAAVRSLPHVQLRDLFNPESLDALRRLFATYDHDPETGKASGSLPVRHLPAMLAELNLPDLAADPPAFARLCTDLRKSSSDHMQFADFVRAVHLCEEDKALKQQQQLQLDNE